MAEAIARQWLIEQKGPRDVFVASAGVSAVEGAMPSAESERTIRALRLRLEGRSKQLTAEMVRRADLVFCMTAEHVEAVRALVADSPDEWAKIRLVDDKADIEDPIGQGQDAYDALARRFMRIIPRRMKEAVLHEDRDRR
jgi:protein-tyrosine-phosphatase